MKASTGEPLRCLSGKVSAKWPEGERFVAALAHGSMSVERYAPVGTDPQGPHPQDELYFIQAGRGEIVIANVRYAFAPGDAFFVAAEVPPSVREFLA